MQFSSVKKILTVAVSVTLMSFSLPSEAQKVGISLPNPDKPRFNLDGEVMKSEIEENGHEAVVKTADRTVETQIKDIEGLIDEGCNYLVIIPVDGSALTEVLKKAKAKNIPVISYDRLIMDSDAVSYYVTFDNYKVGQIFGDYLEQKLNLKNTSDDPKYIEFFSGDQHDHNVESFWNGSMEILKPYLDQGKLLCRSGVEAKEGTYTPNWLPDEAKKRMISLIDQLNIGPDEGKNSLDAVLCHSDGLAIGVIEALYTNAGYRKNNFPVVTGQDCMVNNLKYIKRGMQSMCIFKDARVLAYSAAHMVLQLINGEPVQVNATESNTPDGKNRIPTLLCSPKFVDKDNMRELIEDSGFLDAES
ncbi:putative multiple sugar transport system substrate-binding protein [Succinivibrio dextrinosolvens]|uniref:substrate-binding domain-containing protein n=1 Tax=Succinivibrio dextrinosolvens TaxID=83771 RepID=UPI0008F133AC|nr:sugar-binding protein [Succinivibrio dextrinosolvens]SFS72407.1 putative multiple sugar transport system substrate-binding protein [Succinivibrio dextrinosolvens]